MDMHVPPPVAADANSGDAGTSKSASRRPKGWRTTLRGTAVPVSIRLSNPGIQAAYKTAFEMADAHLYFISVYAPTVLPAELVKRAVTTIEGFIHEHVEAVEKDITICMTGLENAGVCVGEAVDAREVVAKVTSRLARRYLDFFRRADELMRIRDTVWIEGLVDDAEHRKTVKKTRQNLHAVSRLVSETFGKLLDAQTKKPGRAEPGDDTESPAEEPIAALAAA